jgi:hypothetical protein
MIRTVAASIVIGGKEKRGTLYTELKPETSVHTGVRQKDQNTKDAEVEF